MGQGFILLPLGGLARDGVLARWHDGPLAVLPALVAHENAVTRLSYPSQARLAILSGMGKESTGRAVASLAQGGWCSKEARPGGGWAWAMRYAPYGEDAAPGSGDWIRMGRDLVLRGAWAKFIPSAKRLYLVLRGLSLMGHRVDGTWVPNLDIDHDPEGLEDFTFLPAKALDPAGLEELTGLNARTLRHARAWLLENGMMQPSGAGEQPGMVLPYDPGRYSPAVLESLNRIRTETSDRPTGGALKAYRALRKAAIRGLNNSKVLGGKRQRGASQAATTGPTSGNDRSDIRQPQAGNYS